MPTSPPNPSAPSDSAHPAGSRGFRYEAQTNDGRRVTGVLESADAEEATRQLDMLRLRLVRLDPLSADEPAPDAPPGNSRPAGRALRGDDFIAFNQQLAYLAKAGLPVESGLRLIARDLRRGRLAATVRLVADELEQGAPLGEAFDKHRGRFPALYGRLIDAGVRGGDLPAVLLNLGRHLEMVQRLRSVLWRTLSYPLMVLFALAAVLTFLGLYVLPQFRDLYAGMAATHTWTGNPLIHPTLPLPTRLLFAASPFVPYAAGALAGSILLGPFAWRLLRLPGWDRHLADAVALRLPLVGRPLRLNLVARWCDALRIGVSAGMPLPDAVALAADAVRSPRLRRDGQTLIDRLEAGLPLADPPGSQPSGTGSPAARLSLLPATVPVAIALASGHHDLHTTLAALADLYERQAELRVNSIPSVLTPVMVILVALCIGFVILALVLPLVRLLDLIGNNFNY